MLNDKIEENDEKMMCEICGNEIEDKAKYIPSEGAVCAACYEETGRELDVDAIDPEEIEEDSVASEEDYEDDEPDDFFEEIKYKEGDNENK